MHSIMSGMNVGVNSVAHAQQGMVNIDTSLFSNVLDLYVWNCCEGSTGTPYISYNVK